MKKIYVGCSLTHAPKEFIAAIDELKNELRKSYEILEFIGLVGGTERDVFVNDTNMVKACDLFLAECSFPAIGLGYELGTALALNKPVLAIAKNDAKVTRLVLGVDHPLYTFLRYGSISEIVKAVEEKIKTLQWQFT